GPPCAMPSFPPRRSSDLDMGDLPPAGQWVRLEVPASLLGLEGARLNGMSFMLVDGRATWDCAGREAGAPPPDITPPTVTITAPADRKSTRLNSSHDQISY